MDDLYKYNNNRAAKKTVKVTKKLRNGRSNNDPLKIVYISSPMKVKTCESKFRSLVQKLTGKDSEVAMFMEMSMSSSHGREVDSSEVLMDNSRRQEAVEAVEEEVFDFEQWAVRSDQSFSPRCVNVMDERFVEGSYGWETELPWHLLE